MQNPTSSLPPANSGKQPYLTAKTLGFLVVLFLVLEGLVSLIFPHPVSQASDLTIANILAGVNKERQLRNLLTLNTNSMLGSAAQSKADDMIVRKYFSHTDPEGNYIWPKIEAAGYTPYTMLGENLAIEFTNTESLISAWMNSPTHRANILQEGFKDQGVGLGYGDVSQGQYRSAVVNTFGTLVVTRKQTTTPKTNDKPVLSATTPAPSQPAPTTSEPKTTTPVKQTTPTVPAPTTTTTPEQPPRQPLALRGSGEAPSFATPLHSSSSSSTAVTTATSPIARLISNPPLTDITKKVNSYQAGRYLALGVGALLLLLLLADLRVALQKSLGKLDKKANNLILLVLAIIVVALMYWL